jgi:CRISPR-associated protein Cmr2
VGFVWAGHSVPQRDVLQHCREAEKLAKSLGRDRVTIRVLFNNGQFVQWTTPWKYLGWLADYRDRDGGTNWSHVYGDLAHLKVRHAIPPESAKNQDSAIALALFKLYFGEQNHNELFRNQNWITIGDKEDYEVKHLIQWIENMINVGWQLCSNG